MDSAGSSSMAAESSKGKARQRAPAEEDVMIAIRALDDMRSGTVRSSIDAQKSTFSHSTPSLASSASPSIASGSHSLGYDESPSESPDFVSRVSGIPIVNSAIRAYEQGKASSYVVKFGAEMMESSVRSISRPVMDRFPINQLDEFACRQLERLGVYGRPIQYLPSENDSSMYDSSARGADRSIKSLAVASSDGLPSSDGNRSAIQNSDNRQPDVAARGRWQALLLEAGGIGAAMSGESMRKLSYCLQWLQYATGRIDGQILVLKNCITSLSAQQSGEAGGAPASPLHIQTLANVKKDVVETLRQVIDIVSKYAGSALPEPARSHVRQFILHLPQRWAYTVHRQSPMPSPATTPNRKRRGIDIETLPRGPQFHSPILTPASSASRRGSTGSQPSTHAAQQAAQRVLTLATESLDMMRNVTGIVKDSLERAEAWIARLRNVGIDRQSDSSVRLAEEGELGNKRSFERDIRQNQSSSPETSYSVPRPASPLTPTTTTDLSLSALTIASNYTTPLSRVSSLPSLPSLEFDYSRKRPRSSSSSSVEDDDYVAEERLGISAIRGTPNSKEGIPLS